MRAIQILENQIDYNKSKGWRYDSLQKCLDEVRLVDKLNVELESRLLKSVLFLVKLDRHPSHLWWIKNLDIDTLVWELGDDFDYEYFKQRYNKWMR